MGVWRILARGLATKRRAPLRNEAFRLQRSIDRPSSIELVPLSPANQTALAHFDKYYSQTYGLALWSAMRVALLCPSTKVAVLNRFSNEFVDLPDMPARFRGCVDLIAHLSKQAECQSSDNETGEIGELLSEDLEPSETVFAETDQSTIPVQPQLLGRNRLGVSLDSTNPSEFVPVTEFISESEVYTRPLDEEFTYAHHPDSSQLDWSVLSEPVHLPEQLRVLCLRKNRTQFLGSPRYSDGQFDFYPMDLASIIPILALDLQPNDSLLDLCAAPGGKSIVALQTMLLSRLVCMDNSQSRLGRLEHTLQTYGPGSGPELKIDVIHESQLAGFVREELCNGTLDPSRLFDKVLVDVPCSTDRHALHSNSGSVFSPGRAKARLALPTTQAMLLRRAMSVCRPGGTVVYSTCTLSPAQNQFVVQSCLKQVNERDDGMRFGLVDLRPLSRLLRATQPVFGLQSIPVFASDQKDASAPMGLLTIPSVSANYGPAFVAKLKRLS